VKSLVFWGGGDPSVARAFRTEGALFVLWNEESSQSPGVAYKARSAYFTADDLDAVDEAAMAWTKAWGARPIVDGRSFRELLAWKGVPLWYAAELYLHHSTAAPRRVRLIEIFHRILDAEQPFEVEAVGLDAEETLLLARTCTVRKVLFHGEPRPPVAEAQAETRRASWQSRLNTWKTLGSALKSLLARPVTPATGQRRHVLFLSHAAFWRERKGPDGVARPYEHYFDALIPGLEQDASLRPFVVAVGPQVAFRRRGVRDRLEEWASVPGARGPFVPIGRYTTFRVFRETLLATREARALHRRLSSSPGLQEAFSHRGVGFGDISAGDLATTLLLQLPWAVRSQEEAAEVLARVKPAALVLYAESSGWGRAALAAARAASVPSVALQHGILYPKYYSYRHEPQEADCPRPDRTAVFGQEARRLLVEMGRYAPDSLVVTGSPRFDELLHSAQAWDRDALRARHGVGPEERLVVVASRFRGIRETHQSIGSAFPGLLRAVESLPGVRCLVKPHPAEPATAYQEAVAAAGSTRVAVLPPTASMPELLFAADALVTVESLSAVEALVLGRPVVVLNMPTNLRALVESGAALGVPAGADPRDALQRALLDPEALAGLTAARARYLSEVAAGVDGAATARILDLIRATGGAPAEPPARD
jgi:glycosyltransferase involved in cell wall biosynthesis